MLLLLAHLLLIRIAISIPDVKFFMYSISQFNYLGCPLNKLSSNKHAHFAIALDHFQHHPWRVFDPKIADIFFIPLPVDWLGRGLCDKQYHSKESYVVQNLKNFLANSSSFPKKRHFVIGNDFRSKYYVKLIRKMIPSVIIASESSQESNCTVGLGYTTFEAVYHKSNKFDGDHDIKKSLQELNKNAMDSRKYSVSFLGQVDSRPAYHDRLALFQDTQPFQSDTNVFLTTVPAASWTNGTVIRSCVGDDRDRCLKHFKIDATVKVMLESNFSLCFRGDTVGADRFQNSMVYGSIPISVAGSAYEAYGWMPFQSVVPYKDMFVVIPRDVYLKAPVRTIESAIHDVTSDVTRMRHMQALLRQYRPDYDWGADGSRVSNNLLNEVRINQCQYYP